ncbi:MAG: tetratricopeptide repeat protein, partial [Desulfobacterales bacterium]
ILTALQVHLTEGEEARLWAKEAPNLDVHLKSTKALSLLNEGTKESNERFGQLAQEIVDMAPESPLGYRMLGWYYQSLASYGISPRESLKKAYDMAQKALSLNESDAYAHALLSQVYQKMKEYDKSIESGMLAVKFAPNGALIHTILGRSLHHACRDDEALVHLKQAIRLNPFPAYYYHYYLGRCYAVKGQYEEALSEFKKTLQRAPDFRFVHLELALTYALLGREEEARASAVKTMELIPNVSVTAVSKTWPYECEDNLQLVLDAMRKAGFPE